MKRRMLMKGLEGLGGLKIDVEKAQDQMEVELLQASEPNKH